MQIGDVICKICNAALLEAIAEQRVEATIAAVQALEDAGQPVVRL